MKRAFFFVFLFVQCVTTNADTGVRLRQIINDFDLSKSAKEQLEQPRLGKMKKISRPYRYFPELALLCSTHNKKYPLKKLDFLNNAEVQEWNDRKKAFKKFFFTKSGGLFAQSDVSPFVFKTMFHFNDCADGKNKKMLNHLLFEKKPIQYAEFKNGNIALSFKENSVYVIELFPKFLQNLSLEQTIVLAKLSHYFGHRDVKIHPEWFEILLTISSGNLFVLHKHLPKRIIES